MTGFFPMLKGFKNQLKMSLEIRFGKRKVKSSFSLSLPHFCPAGPVSQAGPLASPPACSPLPFVTPGFKNKTRYTPYVSPGSQISHIATNKGNIK
jgi:hypothetical protein